MTRLRRLSRPIAALAVALVVAGCSDDDPAGPSPAEIEVEISGFPAHAHDEGRFELWLAFALLRPGLRHSAAASAGRFQIDASGNVLSDSGGEMTFALDPEDDNVPTLGDGSIAWQLAIDAFVTFEPADDPEPDDPNLPGIVGGTFLNRTAVLTTNYADGLDRDFSAVSGSYHLATPTTPATDDETEGVWFALPGGTDPSLVLPSLPSGWSYHAWLSLSFFGIVSLGGFTSPDGPDFDGPGPIIPGHDGTPYPFPGGDFPLGSAGIEFRGSNVLITLEPPADADGAGPSFLTILAATLELDQAAGVSVPLAKVSTFPTITVVLPASP